MFEREGTPAANAGPRSVRVRARCTTCVAAPTLEFDAKTAPPPFELNTGVAEMLVAPVVFPEVGTWLFDPFALSLVVRSPISRAPALVEVRPWSLPLPTGCGVKEIADVLGRLAASYDPAGPRDLERVFPAMVDFSMSGEPLQKFVAKERDEVTRYVQDRSSAGERIYPYLAYAYNGGANAIELNVLFVRLAPDLPSVPGQTDGYRFGTAGARLHCADLRLLRFNADVPIYRP